MTTNNYEKQANDFMTKVGATMKVEFFEVDGESAGKEKDFVLAVENKINEFLASKAGVKIIGIPSVRFDFRPGYEKAILTVYYE